MFKIVICLNSCFVTQLYKSLEIVFVKLVTLYLLRLSYPGMRLTSENTLY